MSCFQGPPPFPTLDFGLWARVFSAVLLPLEPTILFSYASAVSPSKSRDFRLHEPAIPFSLTGQRFHILKTRDFRFRSWRHPYIKTRLSCPNRCTLLLAQTNHDFNFDDVEIVDRCSQWSHRLFLEAWYSIREPNSINEHVHIPEMYKILANP